MATDYMRAMLDELMGSGGGNDGDGGEGKILTISWVTWVYPFFQFRTNSKAEMFAVLFY